MSVTFRKDSHGIYVVVDSHLYRPQLPAYLTLDTYKSVDTQFCIDSSANGRTISDDMFCRLTHNNNKETWYAHSNARTGNFTGTWQHLSKNSEDYFTKKDNKNPPKDAVSRTVQRSVRRNRSVGGW